MKNLTLTNKNNQIKPLFKSMCETKNLYYEGEFLIDKLFLDNLSMDYINDFLDTYDCGDRDENFKTLVLLFQNNYKGINFVNVSTGEIIFTTYFTEQNLNKPIWEIIPAELSIKIFSFKGVKIYVF